MESQRQLTSCHSLAPMSANSMATRAEMVRLTSLMLQMRIILDSICTRIEARARDGTHEFEQRRWMATRCSHTRIYTMIRMIPARMALLLATALGAAATVGAADASGKQSLEQQQIQVLQQQLGAVQAQMKQLADQNQMLMQKELELERQVAQQTLAARSPAASAS